MRCVTLYGGVLLAILAAGTPAATAQSAVPRGTIVTMVVDSADAGIAGAEVTVPGTGARGYTDDDGRIQLGDIPAGSMRVAVRRLGFRPTTADVAVAAGATAALTVHLALVAQRLRPILVRGTTSAYPSYLAGFYNRLRRGSGYFITRSDIARAQPHRLTDLFREIPGVQLASTNVIQDAVRMRGATNCAPLVWIDGMAAASAEFDLDAIVPESVEGIEVYRGLSEVPAQFMPPMDVKACGVIVVWSRRGGPNERRPDHRVSPAELADLVDALKVYTADEVDTPAHQDTSVHIAPVYPEALFLAGKSGNVTAEFVVDTTGDVAMGTFSAISSTDTAFTASVRRALANAVYVPAVLDGRRVRQVVHQPFTFVPEHGARGAARHAPS